MNKQSLALFPLLLMFWIAISGAMGWQQLLVGTLLGVMTVVVWSSLDSKRPRVLSFRELLALGRCVLSIILAAVESNIAVAKTILFSKPKLSPVVLSMRPAVQSSWGRVLLATAITFTPGSVTIDVDPETGRFIIHTLTEEIADSLIRWNLIDEIAIIETLGQRRLTHEVGTDRTHGFDSPGIAPGNYGADSH